MDRKECRRESREQKGWRGRGRKVRHGEGYEGGTAGRGEDRERVDWEIDKREEKARKKVGRRAAKKAGGRE